MTVANPLSAAGLPLALPLVRDLALSPGGDLLPGPDGDLATVSGLDALLQTVLFRLKTRRGDAYYDPTLGASLDALVGQPLSPETGARAEAQAREALTADGLFSDDAVEVTAYPRDAQTLGLIVSLDPSEYAGAGADAARVTLDLTLDLREGLLL